MFLCAILTINSREQQDLCSPAAARFHEKGCLLVWGGDALTTWSVKLRNLTVTSNNLPSWLARKKRKRRSQLSPCFCVTLPVCFSRSSVYCKLFPIAAHFIPISFSCIKVLFLELFVTIWLGLPWVNQHLHWYHGKNFKVHFKLLVKYYKYSMLRLN